MRDLFITGMKAGKAALNESMPFADSLLEQTASDHSAAIINAEVKAKCAGFVVGFFRGDMELWLSPDSRLNTSATFWEELQEFYHQEYEALVYAKD